MIRATFLLLSVVACMSSAAADGALRSGSFSPPRAAPDFALRGSDDSELKLSRFRGRVVALAFGYTSCPDVCPTTLAELARVRKALGAAGKEIQVVYVTVDPERDTAERLRNYLAAFDPTFIGATGTPEALEAVRKAYGIQIARKTFRGDPSSYLIHHSSFVYLIDRSGNLRALKPVGVPLDDIAHDARILLAR